MKNTQNINVCTLELRRLAAININVLAFREDPDPEKTLKFTHKKKRDVNLAFLTRKSTKTY